MKNKTYIIFILIILALIIASSTGAYYFYRNPIKETVTENLVLKNYVSNKTAVALELESLNKVEKLPKNLNDLEVGGWLADYDIRNGIQTLKEQPIFNVVSPVWYYVNNDGSLQNTIYTNGPELYDIVASQRLSLSPTIALFDPAILSNILNNPDLFNKHLNAIVDATVNGNYDGIDLDYESIYLADKSKFYEFLSQLKVKLNEKNKKLVLTILAKWGDEIDYPLLPQTKRAQDYKRISDNTDEIRIMAYGYRDRYSAEAGPIAPLKWVETIIKYTISLGIPRDKIMLGIPTYSYDWTSRMLAPDDIELENWYQKMFYSTGLEDASAYFNKQVNQVRNGGYNLQETFNQSWGEVVGTYSYKGIPRIMVFPNEDSLKLRKQLAADYGIKGIIYWKLGGEDGLKLQ